MSDSTNNDDDFKMACILGWPVSHSLSPKLHGYWLDKYKISGSYTTLAVPAGTLKAALDMLIARGFAGCNITAPLKEEALSLMQHHDESCLMSGAVNTVVIREGKLYGFNSDGFGFVESLKVQQPHWDGSKVVILGTGGASRGIIASLKAAGAKSFTLVNRTPEKAEKIIKAFSLTDAEVYTWERRHAALEDATMVVNCSNLGQTDNPELQLDLGKLAPTATVCDIVYRPLITPLLAEAQKRGNPIVEGLGMLLHQGRLGFGYWFGRDPEVSVELYKYMGELAK